MQIRGVLSTLLPVEWQNNQSNQGLHVEALNVWIWMTGSPTKPVCLNYLSNMGTSENCPKDTLETICKRRMTSCLGSIWNLYHLAHFLWLRTQWPTTSDQNAHLTGSHLRREAVVSSSTDSSTLSSGSSKKSGWSDQVQEKCWEPSWVQKSVNDKENTSSVLSQGQNLANNIVNIVSSDRCFVGPTSTICLSFCRLHIADLRFQINLLLWPLNLCRCFKLYKTESCLETNLRSVPRNQRSLV